jgi:3-deoxy-D-arabino-heptulosonate 7-phosphate (DAHP) synthase
LAAGRRGWINCGSASRAGKKAISDGAQSLDIAQFQEMMKELEPYIQLWQESRKKEAAAAASH